MCDLVNPLSWFVFGFLSCHSDLQNKICSFALELPSINQVALCCLLRGVMSKWQWNLADFRTIPASPTEKEMLCIIWISLHASVNEIQYKLSPFYYVTFLQRVFLTLYDTMNISNYKIFCISVIGTVWLNIQLQTHSCSSNGNSVVYCPTVVTRKYRYLV